MIVWAVSDGSHITGSSKSKSLGVKPLGPTNTVTGMNIKFLLGLVSNDEIEADRK